MSKLTLEMVQAHAETLGLTVEEDHVYTDWTSTEIDQPGYWMVDPVTGEGPWPDDNFSTSLHEVAGKLVAIEYRRTHPD